MRQKDYFALFSSFKKGFYGPTKLDGIGPSRKKFSMLDVSDSATRWLDYLYNNWPFTAMTLAQLHQHFTRFYIFLPIHFWVINDLRQHLSIFKGLQVPFLKALKLCRLLSIQCLKFEFFSLKCLINLMLLLDWFLNF